ncbi:hypothetical protein ABPG72_013460 [Tetrahymena utriculariae]
MKNNYYLIIFSTIISKLLSQCLDREIYNMLTQKCLKCSSSCQQCFNIGDDNCTNCTTDTYKGFQNAFKCTQTCMQGYINIQNQQCVQCQVEGCSECDANQNCLKCEANLQLSQQYNKCFLQKNICETNFEFIQYPFTKNQCQKICSSQAYQNFETHQCEQIQQCPQIKSIFDNFNQRIIQVNSFLGNQYFIRANQCQFALVNQNLEIINSQILINLSYFEEKYMQQGKEINQKSFIIGNYGGCSAGNSLIIMNFVTLQTVYSEIGLENDFNVGYIDINNQIVFLTCNTCQQIIIFDGINQQVSKLLTNLSATDVLFQISNKQNTTYFFLGEGYLMQEVILNGDRSLVLKSNTQSVTLPYKFVQVSQKNNFLISVSNYTLEKQVKIEKMVFESTQISFNSIAQLYLYDYNVFYSSNLNSIIEYNIKNYDLKISILDSNSDQIIKKFNVSSYKLDQIRIFENQWNNSTFIFFIQNKILSFINLTDYLSLLIQNEYTTIDSLVNTVDTPFITQYSTFTNVIFYKNNIIDIFLSQILQIGSYNYQQIRLQYNLSDNTFQINYFNPNQQQKLYYVNNFMANQNQLMFSIDNSQQNNQFYIFDGNQIYAEQSLRFSKIQFYLQDLQKMPRFNTRQIKYQVQLDLLFYDNVQLISNKYMILSKIIDLTVYEYVFRISNSQLLVNYTYTYQNLFSANYYLQKSDILLVKNVPQIYNLQTQQQFINDQKKYFFSLNNFLILNDYQIAYLTSNDKTIKVLYLVDFQLNFIKIIYTFKQNQNPSIWLIYGSAYPYPLIMQSDIIYIYFNQTYCQPFSIQKQQLIYQPVSLQDQFKNFPSINYQQTGEIFIFQGSQIYVYSIDLQQYSLLNFGIAYPNKLSTYQPLIFNEKLVLYYSQNYFYAFDMSIKQYTQIDAFTSFDLYKNFKVDFYAIDDSNLFIKKSESIIDTTNLITIKNKLENSNYLGKMLTVENTLIHFFQSQNGIYWHLNLLNYPFSVYNITQSQIIYDNQLQQSQIAIYDNLTKMLILFNTIKNDSKIIQFDYNFNLKISILNWESLYFVFINNNNIYTFNKQASQQVEFIFQLESSIIQYECCSQQQIIVVQTVDYNLYKIDISTKTKVPLYVKRFNRANITKMVLFFLKCEQNLIIIYSPAIQFYDLKTDLTSEFPQQLMVNQQQVIPFVDIQGQLLVIFYKVSNNFFNYGSFQSSDYLFDYRQNITNLFYDFKNNILIGVTGTTNQINTIKRPGNGQLFTYETESQFSKNAVFFYQEQNILLLADQTPKMYFYNYLTQNATQYKIKISNIQGVLMEKYKNIVFLYSNFYISAYEYPSMQLIETFTQQNDQSLIQSVYLNSDLSILTVLTTGKVITFDLTEVLYASEVNLLQYQSIQCLNINKEYQVYYNIANLSLNLYKNTQLIDTLLFEPSIYNVYPYLTQLIMVKDNSFIYILFEYLNLIQFDEEIQQLSLIKKVKLKNLPDNFFYDKIQNQVLFLYEQSYQLTSLSLEIQNPVELNLTNFNDGDFSQSFIYQQYIIIPSLNKIYFFDFIQQTKKQITLQDSLQIQFIFKLQAKLFQNYSDLWWNDPFEYEERYNTDDSQDYLLICIIAIENSIFKIFIAEVDTQEIKYSYQIQDSRIVNAVNDPFRQLIYLVNNQGKTQIFDYNLNLIKVIQNSCLKQAKISYDSHFIYSICPNDITIYNGLSFQQQYPKIQSNLKEIIPLSKKQACNIEINQQNRPLENIYTQVYLNNSLTSLLSNQQKLSVIKINYLDQQYIQSIYLDNIQQKNLDSNKPLSIINQSNSTHNNVYWSKNQTYSQNIINIQINNMNLNIIDNITLNQNSQLKNFQMIDLVLNVENSLNIQNFDQVYLQNIKFNSAQFGNNQIIIANNNLVIIENITIDSIQTEQLTFFLTNNANLIIKQIFINNQSKNNIFQIYKNQIIDIQDIYITNSSLISVFQISLCQNLNISNIYLNQVQSAQLLHLQGIIITQVQQINVNLSNQIKIVVIKPFYETTIQYTCLSYITQNINIARSQIQGSYNCTINNLISLNNQVTIMSISQQLDGGGNFLINFSRFFGQEIYEPLIELINVDNILINQISIENNILKQNTFSSIVFVSQCNNISINNSHFLNNTNSNGIGGSMYLVNCLNIQIQNSAFKYNSCLKQNGGAISIQNFMNIAQVYIQECLFIHNSAKFSTGGAINLQYANLIIENSNITSNTALIGGGIYYQQVIPDSILEISKTVNNFNNNNNNQIKSNYARFYGSNIGSTIRKIDIDLKNVKVPKGSIKILSDRELEIREFKSGNKITFEQIQLIDEENNPIKLSNINQNEFQFYSSDVQNFIQSLSVSLNWDQTNNKIQVIGQVQSKQFINNGINLESQIMYIPQSSMSMYIVLDILPKLKDSKGNNFVSQDQFQKKITIDFTFCSIGEITLQQIDSIICQKCPEGKYSLDQQNASCKQCPDSAVDCYGSTINLINGYWRENNQTDIIIYCNKNPQFCQAQSPNSRFICITGHIGPLCQSCDSYGVVWGKRYSQMFGSQECYDCSNRDKQYVDLDQTILCMDSKYHKPFIIYFSLPLLIIWTLMSLLNGIILIWICLVFKTKPYVIKYFNNLLYFNQKSNKNKQKNQNSISSPNSSIRKSSYYKIVSNQSPLMRHNLQNISNDQTLDINNNSCQINKLEIIYSKEQIQSINC